MEKEHGCSLLMTKAALQKCKFTGGMTAAGGVYGLLEVNESIVIVSADEYHATNPEGAK